MKIQKELDETKIVLHKTIESVLERGEKIDNLVAKSDGLSAQSKMFYTQVRILFFSILISKAKLSRNNLKFYYPPLYISLFSIMHTSISFISKLTIRLKPSKANFLNLCLHRPRSKTHAASSCRHELTVYIKRIDQMKF